MESIRSYRIQEKPWAFNVGLEYIKIDESEFSERGFNAEKLMKKPHGGVTKGFNGKILNENSNVVGEVLIGRGYEGYRWLARRGVCFKVVEYLPNDIKVEYEVSFVPRQDISLAYKAFETVGRIITIARMLEDPGGKEAPPPSIHISKMKYVKKKGFLGSDLKLAEIKNIVMILDVVTEELQQGQGVRIIVGLKNLHRVYCNELTCEHHVCDPIHDGGVACPVIKEVNVQRLRDSSYLSRVYSQGESLDEYFKKVKVGEVVKSPNYDSVRPIKDFLDALKESIQDVDLQNSIDKIWMGIRLAKNYYVQTNRLVA